MIQRKKTQRAFTGLVGLPPEPEETPVPAPAMSDVSQVQQIVDRVMDAAGAVTEQYAPTRDHQVRQAVHDAFSPSLSPVSVKRGRGRPRLYSGATVQQRDADRKRVQRMRAKAALAKLLEHFELKPDSAIPPGLKEKYDIQVGTYRELLESETTQAKVLKEVTRDLKMIGAIPSPSAVNKQTGLPLMSNGKYLKDAPHDKGELVVSAKPDRIQ